MPLPPPNREPPVTYEGYRELRREMLEELAQVAAEILQRNPRPLRVREICNAIRRDHGVTITGPQLAHALRGHSDILLWDHSQGHGARWAHRTWLPTLESLYSRARGRPGETGAA